MTKNFSFYALIMMTVLMFSACEKDDPVPVNEEEVITTVNYYLTPVNGGDVITLSFQDLDGEGGNGANVTGGTLAANETYMGRLELLNETESPAEDITEEIEEEDADHQFFFQSDIPTLAISYNDQDANGNPVGLNTTVTTGAAASGEITITLRHEPDKAGIGVVEGDITNAGGETDIEVTIQVNVQ